MSQNIIDRSKSLLGMGCWAIGSEWTLEGQPVCYGKTDNRESVMALEAAYETGIRIFDTAANYGAGLSERLIAEALKGKIENCFVSTKFGFNVDEKSKNVKSYGRDMRTSDVVKHIKQDVDKSLSRLKRDYIDCLFFHIWDYDSDLSLKVRDVLDELVFTGKIRSYGWSIDDLDKIKLWAEKKHCTFTQSELNITEDRPELISLCEELDLTLFNRSPLAMGFLSGKYSKDSSFSKSDVRSESWTKDRYLSTSLNVLNSVREILTTGGRTLTQGALAWLWTRSDNNIPIPGIRTVKQAIENGLAMEYGPLNMDKFNEIERVLGRLKE